VQSFASGLVDVTRDFLRAHETARRIAERHRSGCLTFGEVRRLVADDEDAALFRLKERCHLLFRDTDGSPAASLEGLFDLTVGALFHEAMKFRENFYQHAVYGPKIAALGRQADPEEAELFDEFQKMLEATRERMDESLEETGVLLGQTLRQFRRLLLAYRDEGRLTRYLVENRDQVEHVFGEELDAILAATHASAGAGYVHAARSYLASGYFDRALGALAEASCRGADPSEVAGLRSFAEGMNAYLDGEPERAVERLEAWLTAREEREEMLAGALADLAWAALDRLTATGSTSAGTVRHARELARRLTPFAPRAAPRHREPA